MVGGHAVERAGTVHDVERHAAGIADRGKFAACVRHRIGHVVGDVPEAFAVLVHRLCAVTRVAQHTVPDRKNSVDRRKRQRLHLHNVVSSVGLSVLASLDHPADHDAGKNDDSRNDQNVDRTKAGFPRVFLCDLFCSLVQRGPSFLFRIVFLLQLRAVLQRLQKRHFVDVLKVTAHGNTAGDPRHTDAGVL